MSWIEEAQKRVDAATVAPWGVYDRGVGFYVTQPNGEPLPEGHRTDLGRRQDAEFIAAARTDLPKALKALRAVHDLADAYEKYAAVCERDAQTGSSDSPIRKHWASEAAQARLFVRRIRAAISA